QAGDRTRLGRRRGTRMKLGGSADLETPAVTAREDGIDGARAEGAAPGVLYISYDGILEPLGYSQVLSYLKVLARGCRICLVSFEKQQDWNKVAERERLSEEISLSGITWVPLRYHKRPSALATAWDILQGISVGGFLLLRHRLRIVHARSYVPAVMAL